MVPASALELSITQYHLLRWKSLAKFNLKCRLLHLSYIFTATKSDSVLLAWSIVACSSLAEEEENGVLVFWVITRIEFQKWVPLFKPFSFRLKSRSFSPDVYVKFGVMEGICVGGTSCLFSFNKTHITNRIRNPSCMGLRNSSQTAFCLSKLNPKSLNRTAGKSMLRPVGLGLSKSAHLHFFATSKSFARHKNEKCLGRFCVRAEAEAEAEAEAASTSPPKQILGVEVKTLKKVIPLGLMFFCILFNYTILRDTKDVLVVTAKGSSAEIIPFLKTWVNLPMAIGFMIIYTKLSNVLSKEALFYACILPFIAFFGAFAFILYPLNEYLHPVGLADKLLQMLGPRFLGPLAILRIWTFCLFYVMAELWGSVVVSVLFWGFANQITTVDEAKQFYPLFGLGANIALVFSGRTVKYFSHLRKNLGPGVDGWGVSLKGMMSLVVLLGFAITGIYWWANKYVVNDPTLPKAEARKKKEKPKLGMVESAKFLLRSTYVRDLATLVVAYGISINLVEVTWKSKLKAQYPSPNEYSAFMGDFSTYTGIATFSMMLLSRYIFRKYGWGVAAIITPTVLLVTGVAFFSLVLCGDTLAPLLAKFGTTPLLAAVYVGAMQNIFSKSAKYSLFDPCKEMAYIPLDEDTKVKGKAAIDVVCNPLGKSGGALIQQVLILGCGSLANATPYLGAILLVIVLAWLYAARSLDQQFTPLVKKDLKSKLLEGKLSAMARAVSANLKKRPVVTYRFVSVLNDQGFIEGRYVPVTEGNIPTAQSDGNIVAPASPPMDKLESTTRSTDVAEVVRPTESSDGAELHSS